MGRCYHASVAVDGYLYVIGGWNGSALNDVQFAPMHTNGTLGTWRATNSISSGRYRHTSVAYDHKLYILGGYDLSSLLDEVQVAPIDPIGVLGNWSATSSFTTARNYPASVACQGYLYVLGGYGSSGAALDDVQYAPINPDGTVGPTWTATTSFTTARFCHASVAWDGYLYVIGGWGGGTTYFNDVQYAPIHSDGTVGTWTSTTSFATARYNHASVACNGYLYVTGGWSGGSSKYNDVQYAPINSDGTVGAWNTTLPFTTGRAGHASVAYGGYLYVIGGYASSSLNDVQFAPFHADGTVGAWGTTTSFATPRYYQASVAYNGYLYVIGGNTDSGRTADVRVAQIHAGGTVGAWTSTAALPTPTSSHASVAYNGYLYAIGGWDTACLARVLVAPVNASGTVDAWAATTSFTGARSSHTSVAYNGYLYLIGGYDGSVFNEVRFAPIHDDGTIGAWTATTSISPPRRGHASVAYNGYLYVTGGWDNGARHNDVQFAPFHADGTIGAWTDTNGFTTERAYHASVAYNGYLYVIGGETAPADVQFAPIHADGTVGAWATTTSLTPGRAYHTSVAYNGFLYVLGGNSPRLNDVQFAPFHTDGTIGDWTATTSFSTGRAYHTSVAFNGFLYVMGGGSNTTYLSDVQFAPIQSDGAVGAWNATTGFAPQRYAHSSAAYGGYVYLIGGFSGTSNLDDVQFATLGGPAARGAYSKLLDTGSANNVMQSLTFDGGGGSRGRTLTYAVAPEAGGVFGARTTVPDAVPGSAYTPNQCGRYVWVRFDLNDCDAATIDSGGSIGRKDVTGITLTYSPLAGVGDTLNGAKTTAVHLTWSASSGATSYNVLRCDATAGHCTPAAIGSTTDLFYNDAVLGDGSTYWYAIAAVNGSCTAE